MTPTHKEIAVKLHGVKKRCRKVDFEYFRIKDVALNDFNLERDKEALLHAAKVTIDLKMRSVYNNKATLVIKPVEISEGCRAMMFPDPAEINIPITLE